MASRTKFYAIAEALDLITMDCGTEVCAEDISSEDEDLIYPDKVNDGMPIIAEDSSKTNLTSLPDSSR
ncbi:hypothetical protein AMECASPLE_038099 [Ameca splendens]|uniref:Uncharacterized protein n=1 Tax=Ameca splendens TaxID=208324 RepID=A0ABV0YJ85_9TELE